MTQDEWKSLVSRYIGPGLFRQEQFSLLVGDKAWQADATSGVVAFEDLEFPMQIIGSWAPDGSWLWAWANELPDSLVKRSLMIRQYGEDNGVPFFTQRKLPIAEDEQAFLVAIVAAATVSGDPVYWAPNQESRIALSVSAPLPPLANPIVPLPRLLATALNGPFDVDHVTVVTSLLGEAGFEVDHAENGIHGFGPAGSVVVDLNDEGLATNFRMTSSPEF